MSLDITPGDGIVGELELLGDLIVGGFPEAVFTLPGVSVDEVLDHARLYLGFAEAAQTAQARVWALELPEFVGVEGEFFRGRVPGELGMQLGAAVESYSRVGSGIKELARELDASQAALKPLEARARAVFEHMQKVWIKVNVPFTEYSGLRSEWDDLVRAAGVVHERVAVAGQQAAAQINAGTEAMVPVNDYFSSLPGGAVAGGVVARGVRSTAARAVSAAGGVTGGPGRAVKATADGLGVVAGAAVSVPQQITARGQQLAPQVTPDGIKVGDHLLTDPASEQAQQLVREGLATNILGLDPTGIPTAMMMLASPNTLIREQPRKKAAGRRWSGEGSKAQSIAQSAVGQVVSVPGRFVGGAVDRFGNTIAGNAALIGVGGDPVRAWSGLLSNVTSPVAGAGRAVASATPEQILADPVAAAGSAATHAPVAVPFVGWAYGIVEALSKPGELAREGAKETLTSALDTLTLKNLEAGQAVANTAEVHVTTPDVDVHADNGGYVTFTLPDLEGGEPKAWYILATPDSPGNFTTNVPTAPGEELIERADGSVVLVNTATSQTVRTIKTPWAKDALGRDQPTWYSIDKVNDQTSTITQHIAPNKGALYPLIADPVSVTTGGQMTSGDSPPVGPKDNQTPSNLPAASAGPSSGSSSGSSPSRGSSSNPPPARTTPVAPPPPPPPPPPPADPSSPGDNRSQGEIGPREDPGTGTGINDGSGVFDGGAHIDDGSGPITPPTGGSGSGVGAGSGFVIPGKGIDDGFSKPVDGLDDAERSKYRLLDYVIGGDKLPDQTSGPRPPDGVQVVIRDGGGYYWAAPNVDGTTSVFLVDRDGNVHLKILQGSLDVSAVQKLFPPGAIIPLDALPDHNKPRIGMVDPTGQRPGVPWTERGKDGEVRTHVIVPGAGGQTIDSRVVRKDGSSTVIRSVGDGQGGYSIWSDNSDGSASYAHRLGALGKVTTENYPISPAAGGTPRVVSVAEPDNSHGQIGARNPDGTVSVGDFTRTGPERYRTRFAHPDGSMSVINSDRSTPPVASVLGDGPVRTSITDLTAERPGPGGSMVRDLRDRDGSGTVSTAPDKTVTVDRTSSATGIRRIEVTLPDGGQTVTTIDPNTKQTTINTFTKSGVPTAATSISPAGTLSMTYGPDGRTGTGQMAYSNGRTRSASATGDALTIDQTTIDRVVNQYLSLRYGDHGGLGNAVRGVLTPLMYLSPINSSMLSTGDYAVDKYTQNHMPTAGELAGDIARSGAGSISGIVSTIAEGDKAGFQAISSLLRGDYGQAGDHALTYANSGSKLLTGTDWSNYRGNEAETWGNFATGTALLLLPTKLLRGERIIASHPPELTANRPTAFSNPAFASETFANLGDKALSSNPALKVKNYPHIKGTIGELLTEQDMRNQGITNINREAAFPAVGIDSAGKIQPILQPVKGAPAMIKPDSPAIHQQKTIVRESKYGDTDLNDNQAATFDTLDQRGIDFDGSNPGGVPLSSFPDKTRAWIEEALEEGDLTPGSSVSLQVDRWAKVHAANPELLRQAADLALQWQQANKLTPWRATASRQGLLDIASGLEKYIAENQARFRTITPEQIIVAAALIGNNAANRTDGDQQ